MDTEGRLRDGAQVAQVAEITDILPEVQRLAVAR